jgi:6-pyruvoyl-tetrahydropterin synthase
MGQSPSSAARLSTVSAKTATATTATTAAKTATTTINPARFLWDRLQTQLQQCDEALQEPERSREKARHRRETCCGINGMSNFDAPSAYGATMTMKPQWLHSASSVHVLLRYPAMRGPRSFASLIDAAHLGDEYLQLSAEVLRTDPDGLALLASIDVAETNDAGASPFSNAIVQDPHNSSALVVSTDGRSATHIDADSPILVLDAVTRKPLNLTENTTGHHPPPPPPGPAA